MFFSEQSIYRLITFLLNAKLSSSVNMHALLTASTATALHYKHIRTLQAQQISIIRR